MLFPEKDCDRFQFWQQPIIFLKINLLKDIACPYKGFQGLNRFFPLLPYIVTRIFQNYYQNITRMFDLIFQMTERKSRKGKWLLLLHNLKSEIWFSTGSNPACSMLEICNGENLWQEIRLIIFLWSTIPQKTIH